jgi:nicotinate-nucleotide adenylyltransferase
MMALDGALPALPASGRVGLLGGSFNPPHLAHALLAHAVLAHGSVDAVWVLPCADHPFGKPLAPFAARKAMCRLAFRHLSDVAIVDVEQRLPTPSYTVQTLRALREALPALRPSWIVGSDILDELHKWREHEALETLCELLVIPRSGYRQQGALGFDLPEVSSTDIRARLARGEGAAGLIDRAVGEHIVAEGLYGPDATGAG